MASTSTLLPSPAFKDELRQRGAEAAGRCYQCATCSAVCELAPAEAPFPRRLMLSAQWGLADRVAADPATWLCHQCNDCTVRCPRDARPGDAVQAMRSLAIERLAFPAFAGRLVGRARVTWPLLFLAPVLFWVALLGATGHLQVPADLAETWAYDRLVPHVFIYSVFFTVAAWVMLAAWVSARRLWTSFHGAGDRKGSFLANLWPALVEIATHKRFGTCQAAHSRKLGHLALLWGFVGAAVTSGLLIVAMYIQHLEMPLALSHPYKILGNVSAAALIVGGAMLIGFRLGDDSTSGRSTAFDTFFLTLVAAVIATGMAVELARLANSPALALWVYIVHLGTVMALFLTFPYSKFAHMLYRTLAMVHARMTGLDVTR
ncbi:MAG: quinone-interacting membrane-bound oxidoreductase complex subunit QmoC [Acidobacteriota bacterium]